MIEKQVFRAPLGATIKVTPEPTFGNDTVSFSIHKDYMWTPGCIKSLRKFLKKLQKQLEAAESN